jgi:hypothetical protein
MKKLFSILFLAAITLLAFSTHSYAQDTTVVTPTGGGGSILGYLNAALLGKIILWATVASGVLTALAKVIPTDKPGTISTVFTWLNRVFAWIFSFIPDSKATGGTHK